jgi:hypothetical protein
VSLLAAPEGGTGDPVATTFTPPTRPMGWGNVSHALSLAQDALARLGITQPTNAQLQAALMGGDVTGADGSAVALRGILQMRADGMGWGQIAKASGTTMGAVVSSTRAMQGKIPATTPATEVPAKPEAPVGIITADGSAAPLPGGKSARGITTAAGASTGAAKGTSKGLMTAQGTSPVAASRGIVTASGSAAGVGSATVAAHGRGSGVVSATGAAVSSGAVTAAGPGHGQGLGNGNGNGHANGKGKGG